MQYVAPILALICVACWAWFEVRGPNRTLRLLAGAVTTAMVASAGYHLGRFAEFNRQRYYPLALIEISKQLRSGHTTEVESAIAQVFESGSSAFEVDSIELMRALESTKTTDLQTR
jgi:hypothetical protein